MENRFQTLDGWRAVSILAVIAGHTLPIGPARWALNGAVASGGMVLFFILSGFLITTLLHRDQDIGSFFVRRLMRIVPLAWAVLAIVLLLQPQTPLRQWVCNLLFVANWPPMQVPAHAAHFWSLSVEVQFYVAIGLIVALCGRRGLWALPLLAIAVTINRIVHGATLANNTYFRIDEILAGCCLALIAVSGRRDLQQAIGRLPTLPLLALVFASAHDALPASNYARPYLAMLAIGSTLFDPHPSRLKRVLDHPVMVYIASISYALYVFHGVLVHTWLAQGGSTVVRYAKRPLYYAAVWLLSHLSTRHYEHYWIELGKRFIGARRARLRQRGSARDAA